MLNAQVFKKSHTFGVILFVVIAYGIYLLSKVSPLEQTIVHKEQVNSQVSLFITEANAGATSDFSYRFYLYDSTKNDEDFKGNLMDNSSPFLVTSDSKALSKVENGVIYLNVKGVVYSFNNNPAYKYNNSIYAVPVVLTAKPY